MIVPVQLASLAGTLYLTFAPVQAKTSSPQTSTESSSKTASATKTGADDKNGVSIKGSYAFQLLNPRDSGVEGEEAPHNEHLGGFILSYERVLISNWLGVAFSKPFYFAPGRFDSPFELMLKLLHRFGAVEPFVAVGPMFNVRVFDKEREEVEGRTNDLSFGIVAAAGSAFFVADRWAIEIEGGYAWTPIGYTVVHEFSASLGPVFTF